MNIRKAFLPKILTECVDPRIREQEFGNIAALQKLMHDLEEHGNVFYRFT